MDHEVLVYKVDNPVQSSLLDSYNDLKLELRL